MEENIDFLDIEDYSDRWVSYFDLLGFSKIVNKGSWIDVWLPYSEAIKEVKKEYGFEPPVERIWFSDTFIFYSTDDEKQSFPSFEEISRSFIYRLTERGIPVRGAMSFGKFYANKENNIFFGPALVEAYKYGEQQDWIGFILTPSAVSQMEKIGLPICERLNYAYWDIPFKSSGQPKFTPLPFTNLPAYIIGGNIHINGRNICLEKLQQISNSLLESKNHEYIKYENAIRFITTNDRYRSTQK
jgi:hypothetical protein